jgi:hypothetical protein
MKKRRMNHPADQPAAWDAIALRIAKILRTAEAAGPLRSVAETPR